MALVLLAAGHHDIDLADVERLAVGSTDLAPALRDDDAVRGAMVLATCNRLEIYLDAHPGREAEAASRGYRTVAEAAGMEVGEVAELMAETSRVPAVRHLFDVASGLDSMVVGEREISGQVRRAVEGAREAGTSSRMLETAVSHALRASRKVAVVTDLARSGRSVVSVALDLAAARRRGPGCRRTSETWAGEPIALPTTDWRGARAVLVGTGAYAGASLAALRARGCSDVTVWSASDRAAAFARSHACAALPGGDTDALAEAIAGADLVVTCRGTGTTTLDVDLVRHALDLRARLNPDADALAVLDLALRADVESAVGELPGVALVDLEAVRRHSPAAVVGEVERAQQIVNDAVADLTAEAAGRDMDDVVVALRGRVAELLEAELERLPRSGTVSAEDAAQAMRRLAARLVHGPTVSARAAGREGRGAEYVDALRTSLGLDLAHLLPPAAPAPHDPARQLTRRPRRKAAR